MPGLKLNNISGFTLVEMLVVILIFASILGVILGIQASISDLFCISKEKADLQAQTRLAIGLISDELKSATRASTQTPSPNLSIPPLPDNKSVIFYLPEDKDGDGLITDANGDIEWATDKAVHYQFVPGIKVLKRLTPYNSSEKIIAQDVSDTQFIDASIDPLLDINELRIILMLNKTTVHQREISVTLTSIVKLRN